jgi:hypothetical protein
MPADVVDVVARALRVLDWVVLVCTAVAQIIGLAFALGWALDAGMAVGEGMFS